MRALSRRRRRFSRRKYACVGGSSGGSGAFICRTTTSWRSSPQISAPRRDQKPGSGDAPAAPLAAAGRSARSSKASGRASTAATRLSRRMLMPAMSIAGRALRRSMSRASARLIGTNCGRSLRASRASASCSASSAARTLPASCSCCEAMASTCSISASCHSSRLRDRSWYSASSASCWLCDSARRASNVAIFACASRSASCAARATERASRASASMSRSRCASSCCVPLRRWRTSIQ